MEQTSESHRTSNANSSVSGSAAGMGWRGAEKIERKEEWLEKGLRDYAEFGSRIYGLSLEKTNKK